MTIDDAWRIAAAAVFFVIAIVAVSRTADNPLARSLAAFSIGLSTYVVLELTSTRTEIRPLTWCENAAASLSIVAGVDLLVGFVGRRRELRGFRIAAAAVFVALALAALSPFVAPELASLQREGSWQIALAVAMGIFFGRAAVLLVQHYKESTEAERGRVILLFGSLLLGAGSAGITLLADAGMDAPRVLEPGLAGSGVLLAALVLRSPILGTAGRVALANVVIVALLAVLAEIALYAWVGRDTALFVFGTLILVIGAFASVSPFIAGSARARARAEHHAALGRLASQMAHDLKNPLAAILGAAEILEEERARGRALDEQGALVTLVLEQAKRLRAVVDDYQRLARVEPKLGRVDVAALLRGVCDAQRLAAPDGISIELDLASALPELRADGDMLAVALESAVRNAIEAMPNGGRITLRAASGAEPRADVLRVEVVDTGFGMDARTLERATESFFTTKATGSGLGLAYVARVAEAHRGVLRITSAEGAGTTVALSLPILPT